MSDNDSNPETREAIMDPCFEPTGYGEFRLVVRFALQTRTGPHQWHMDPARPVTLLEHLSAHTVAAIIAAGGEALATTARDQYNEITDTAWQRDREQQEATATVPGEFPLVVKTTSDSKHALRFSSEADRDEFVADTVDGEASIIIAEGYGDNERDDVADAAISARIESSACDQ